ncbi:SGNH/GDSL hydrolase family protein [Pseudomonas helleri]|uniref:SGNH/GDSL hydrolase family protein n=1 Tax=Pseudomonas helleri TaxID=1608996 RepID=UPI003FD3EF0D
MGSENISSGINEVTFDSIDEALRKKVDGVFGKNIFNPNSTDVAIGFFPSVANGLLQANANYNTSGYISVEACESYTFSSKHYVVWYNSAKAFIAGSGSDNSNKTQVAPEGAAYVRASARAGSDWSLFQVERGNVQTGYEPYSPYAFLDPTRVRGNSISGQALAVGSLTQKETNFLHQGKNLFNKNVVSQNVFISPQYGTLTASANYDTSEFIPVAAGKKYTSSRKMRFTCYFDVSKTVVVPGGASSDVTTFTPPLGAAFVRITTYKADLSAFQLELGAVSTGYERYGFLIYGPNGEVLLGVEASNSGKWLGKTWATLGDSITAGGLWQPSVVAQLGLTWTNFGIGGTKLSGSSDDPNAMCQDVRINAIPVTQDLVTVMGGTNDWAQNVPLGVVDSLEPLTFYGALNTLISKLMARFPGKRVALFTTPYGELIDFANRGWPNSYTNTRGLTTRDYAEAVRVACKYWGLPCIDVQGCAGWNALNIRTYITDDGALLHPNATGAARIAEVSIGGFNNIEPVS